MMRVGINASEPLSVDDLLKYDDERKRTGRRDVAGENKEAGIC